MEEHFQQIDQQLIDEISKRQSITTEVLKEQWHFAKVKGVSFREQLQKTKTVDDLHFQESLSQVLSFQFLEKIPVLSVEWQDFFTEKMPIRYAKKYLFFPIKVTDDLVTFAVIHPWPTIPYEDIAYQVNRNYEMILSTEESILEVINLAYNRKTGTAEEAAENLDEDEELKNLMDLSEDSEDLLDAEDEEPIKKLVSTILFQSVKEKASDIHIDPSNKETTARYRIDGVLHQITTIPKQAHIPLVNRIKVMSGLDISVKNKTQDGRTNIVVAGKKIDIRVSILPTVYGERAVLRLLIQGKGVTQLDDLGMNPRMVTNLEMILNQPHGIFLVTGPTGSGKTTTLYAALSQVDEKVKNVITVEDPVEYQVSGYGQVQVNEKIGLTFSAGLRSILRQDPDVIMVGEIRDAETAQVAIQASLTGHLVLSTLHTNDSVSTIIRLVDMGIEPFLVTSTLGGVIAQRLIRRICNHCKEEYSTPKEAILDAGFPKTVLDSFEGKLWRGKGCNKCLHTGYLGRVGVYELLIMNDEIRKEILAGSDTSTIRKVAVKDGLHLLAYDCAEKVLQGMTTIEEMVRVIYTEEN
ncbi:MAG: general secretion pathway protein E [bacterium]|jgi:general secretion pathway protein E